MIVVTFNLVIRLNFLIYKLMSWLDLSIKLDYFITLNFIYQLNLTTLVMPIVILFQTSIILYFMSIILKTSIRWLVIKVKLI